MRSQEWCRRSRPVQARGPLLASAVRLCGRSERFSPHLRTFGQGPGRFGVRTLTPGLGWSCNLQDVPESLSRAHWCTWFGLELQPGGWASAEKDKYDSRQNAQLGAEIARSRTEDAKKQRPHRARAADQSLPF